MKKIFTLFIACFSHFIFAQLSGTYTIGAMGSNYTTVQDAVTALQTNGISGPVVFNIQPGSYSVFQLQFGTVAGVGSANSITFQSQDLNANSVVFNGCNMRINTNGVTFRKITFDVYHPVSTANGNALTLKGNFNTVTDCVFINSFYITETIFNSNKVTKSYIVLIGSDLTINNNTFLNSPGCCILKNDTTFTTTNLVISNNIFNGSNVYAINLSLVTNATVSGNIFSSTTIHNTILGLAVRGNILIERNSINNDYDALQSVTESSLSLNSSNQSASTVSNLIIKNNFINSKAQNLRADNFKNVKIINNNFKSAFNCLHIQTHYLTSSYMVQNNVLYSTGDHAIYFLNSINNALVVTDYNAYSYNNDKQIYSDFFTSGLESYSFTNWQSATGREAHSKVTHLVYASDTDLHTPNAQLLSNAGILLSDVTTDFDGQPRNASPDIGADEFDMDYSSFRDLELIAIVSPSLTDCNTTNTILTVKNNGTTVVNNFDIKASINFYPNNLASFTTPINPDQTVQVTFGNLPLIPNNYYERIAFEVRNPNNLLDNNFSNNFKILNNYTVLGDFPITVEKDNCGAYKSLTIAFTDATILWSTGQNTNKILINQAGTYSVTVTNSIGCSYTKSITLN